MRSGKEIWSDCNSRTVDIEVRRLVRTFGTLWVLNSPGTADLSRSSVSRSLVSKQKADCIKKKKTIQFNISHTGKFRLGSRPVVAFLGIILRKNCWHSSRTSFLKSKRNSVALVEVEWQVPASWELTAGLVQQISPLCFNWRLWGLTEVPLHQVCLPVRSWL